MKNPYLLPILASITFSQSLYSEEVYQQDKTVVTASRYEQSREDVIPSVTVIDRDEIDNLQSKDILDILSLQAGIDVARSGGFGSATSVFMRGTNSNHVLVLINGMQSGSTATGSFAWEHLPVSQIERIEIVRGTRVSYYGTDAIGGVINIITRKQQGTSIRMTGGSYDSQSYDLALGNSKDKFQYSLSLGYQESNGFSATNENNLYGYNPDDDGYKNKSINFGSTYTMDSGSQFSLKHFETRGDVDFDSSFNVGHSKNTEQVSRLVWQGELFSQWQSEIAIGRNKNTIDTKAFSDGYNTERRSVDLLANKQIENHKVGLGLSYKEEDARYIHHLVSPFNYAESRTNKAFFVNWLGNFEQNTLSMSARYDDNNTYGADTTANLDWAYLFNDKVRFNFSAGTAFHAPDMNALYSPSGQLIIYSPELDEFVNFYSFEGNPDLKPETSTHFEIGLKAKLSVHQNLAVNIFHYEIDNLFDYQGPTFKPVNILESRIKGLEINYGLNFQNWSLNANATIQDAENKDTGEALLRRPDEKLNISFDRYLNNFSIGSSLRYASQREDYGVTLQGYTVIDLRAAYRFNDNWKLAFRLENMTDEEYQLVNGYNTPGASGYVTLEWRK